MHGFATQSDGGFLCSRAAAGNLRFLISRAPRGDERYSEARNLRLIIPAGRKVVPSLRIVRDACRNGLKFGTLCIIQSIEFADDVEAEIIDTALAHRLVEREPTA